MGKFLRLHAHSRHGKGKSWSGARRRRHHSSRTRLSEPDAPGREHERSKYQAQTRARLAFAEIGRAIDRSGPQASAQNQLLIALTANPVGTGCILTPMRGPRKATA